MNPIELVKRDLGDQQWTTARQSFLEPIVERIEECPFSRHRLFMVRGRTGQFDFPTLPHGSYGYYVADGQAATRLTRKGKEIQSILADEWDALPALDPVRLASLVLHFFNAGIGQSHFVLGDAESLRAFGRNYQVDEKEFDRVLPEVGLTRSTIDRQVLSLRAITLRGWKHMKQNLGIELLAIRADGSVSLATRHVLSHRIFTRIPALRY